MSIRAKCRKCGRAYNLKSESAGKKFRCKECQALVAVPMPKPEVLGDDVWETDDEFGYEDYEDYGDDYADDYDPPPRRRAMPAPRRLAPKKKKPAAKKKRPRKRSSSDSGGGGSAAKIGGGIFTALIVAGYVIRLLAVGGFDFGTSWESYTTSDGNITVQMPGKATLEPFESTGSASTYSVRHRDYACSITIQDFLWGTGGASDNEIVDSFVDDLRAAGASNIEVLNIQGHPSVKFSEELDDGVKARSVAFLHNNKGYTLTYAYTGSVSSSKVKKFFDSVQFN